jgi:hypothetical protein
MEKPGVIRFAVPQSIGKSKVSGLSVLELSHLIVNISGAGINPTMFRAWDFHRTTAPSSFVVDGVPSGSGRLIQVLAIYSNDGADEFYYGDVSATIEGETSVHIPVTQLGDTGVGEGSIAGRYLDALGNGPTGKLTYYYSPTGKPRMKVHVDEMIGGWFQLFALKGQGFEYELDDGISAPILMFGGAVGTDSTALFPASGSDPDWDRVTRVYVPEVYQSHGGPTSDREYRAPAQHVLGWFGPGAVGQSKQICYEDPSPTNIPYGYTTADVNDSTEIMWDANGTSSAVAHIDDVTAVDSSVNRGGLAYSIGSENLCDPGGDRYVDFLSIDYKALANHDGALAFQLPVKMTDSGSSYRQRMNVTINQGTDVEFSWEFLPGVTVADGNTRGIDGVDIYWRALPENSDNRENYKVDDMAVCGPGMLTVATPFQLFGGFPVSSGAVLESLPTNAMFDAANDEILNCTSGCDQLQFVTCYYNNTAAGKRYFTSVMSYETWSGGGSNSPPASIAVSGNTVVSTGGCAYVDITLQDANGYEINSSMNSTTTTVDLYQDTGDVIFYDDYCGGNAVTSITIDPGNSRKRIAMDATTESDFSFMDNAAVLDPIAGTLAVVNTTAITNIRFVKASGLPLNSLGTNQCMGVKFSGTNGNGSAASAYSNSNVTFSTYPGVTYYAASNCSGVPLTQIAWAGSAYFSNTFYVKAAQAGWASLGGMMIGYEDNGVFYDVGTQFGIPVGGAGVAAILSAEPVVAGPYGTATPNCYEMRVRSRDALGNLANITGSSISVNVHASGPITYSNSACSPSGTQDTSTLTIAAGANASTSFWVHSSSGGTFEFSAQESGGGGSTSPKFGSSQMTFTP